MRTGVRRSVSMIVLSGVVGLTGSLALAQTPQNETALENETTEVIEDIVVTALRRDTRLQDTPAAITALGGETLQRLGVSDFHDYYRNVPSLQITDNPVSPGASRISLRSIRAAGEAAVGLYYGETPVTGPAGSTADAGQQQPNLNLFDVQRVEVLRGPQGTLYGSGSVGGTIRVLFEQPDPTAFGGHAEAEASTTEQGEESGHLRAVLNVPLVHDQLALRLVGGIQEIGGYIDNVHLGLKDVNSGSVSGGRAILAWTPSADFDLTGTIIRQDSEFDSNSSWYQRLGKEAHDTDAPLLVPYDDEFTLYSATANWNSPFGRLTASSSYYEWDIVRNVDVTSSFGALAALGLFCQPFASSPTPCTPTQQADYRAYIAASLPAVFHQPFGLETQTHELRLASRSEEGLRWTVGLFYEDRDDYIDSYTSVGDAVTGQLVDPLRVYNGHTYGETTLTQFSQFAEASLKVLPRLTLTGGARHFSYDKETWGVVDEPNYVYGSFVGPPTRVDNSESGWVGKVNLAYEFVDDALVYVQWAQGFRPGGGNRVSAAGFPESLRAYDSDSIDSYEIGIKAAWVGGRYTLNAALFQIDWADMQSTLNWPPAFRIVAKAGDARIQGLELEGTARPFAGLTLTAGLTYTPEADLTSGQTEGTGITPTAQTGLKGDRIPYTPEITAALSAQYDWTVSNGLDAFVRADANYVDGTANEFRPTYNVYETLPSFTEVNLRAGVDTPEWGVHLFIKNLTDEVGGLVVQSTLTPLDPGRTEREMGSLRPRTFGVNITRRF